MKMHLLQETVCRNRLLNPRANYCTRHLNKHESFCYSLSFTRAQLRHERARYTNTASKIRRARFARNYSDEI